MAWKHEMNFYWHTWWLSPILDLSLALLDLLDLSPIFGLSKFDYLKQKSVFFVNDAL